MSTSLVSKSNNLRMAEAVLGQSSVSQLCMFQMFHLFKTKSLLISHQLKS